MKKTLVIAGGILVIAIIFLTFKGSGDKSAAELFAKVERGQFVVDVSTTGELEAKNSTKIMGPSTLRTYRIWNVTIQDMIDEGSFVKKGDYVASLDPSELTGRIKDAQIEMETRDSKYIQTQLDTTLQMRESRNELINLKYAVDEKQLILDQSQFEPPATIKQAEIEVDKAKRAYTQAQQNYLIKRDQNIAKMQEAAANRNKQRNELDGMLELQAAFTVKAPEEGMLIYEKDWDGKPIKEGSQIGAWDPVVATLPDLSALNSITYVNEVDIRLIKEGQTVDLGLDAFPDKKLSGKVTKVANVGEQRPNSEAKVFKIIVEVDEIDDTMRPGMTTSNRIITKSIEDAVYIPLEALRSFQDTVTYVLVSERIGYTKQEVQLGVTNSNFAQVLSGLSEGQTVYLSTPADLKDDGNITLLKELNGKRNKDKKPSTELSSNTSPRS